MEKAKRLFKYSPFSKNTATCIPQVKKQTSWKTAWTLAASTVNYLNVGLQIPANIATKYPGCLKLLTLSIDLFKFLDAVQLNVYANLNCCSTLTYKFTEDVFVPFPRIYSRLKVQRLLSKHNKNTHKTRGN